MSTFICAMCGFKVSVDDNEFPNNAEDLKKLEEFFDHMDGSCDAS